MAINLKGRSFLTLADFTPAEIRYLLDLGHDLKAKRRAGVCAPTMQGKHIVLLFEKTRYLPGRRLLSDGQKGVSGGLRQGAGPVL